MRVVHIVPVVAAAAALFLSGGTVTAARPVHERFHDEVTFTDANFCGAGLSVETVVTVDGRGLIRTVGPNRLIYFSEHIVASRVFTNTETGVSISSVDRVLNKDLHVRDNGNGTLTVTFFATGNSVVFGPDGKAIARNPGQVRFQVVVNHGGTPTFPDDDTEVSFRVLKESTGRSDDFCTAAVEALT